MEGSYYTALAYSYLIDYWNSIVRVSTGAGNVPVLILSAGQDNLISPHQQTEMKDAIPSLNKWFLFDENADHGAISALLALNDGTDYDEFFEMCIGRAQVSA